MLYSGRIDNKEAFTKNVFSKFTKACGGDAKDLADIIYAKFTVEDFAYHDDMHYWGVVDYFEKTVVPHKIAVYQAGVELAHQPWISKYLKDQEKEQFHENLWLHDISKFSANEAFGYAMYNRKTGHGKEAFEVSWHHHKMNNPHHPEYWLNPDRSGKLDPIPMPALYVIEMISDWIGAGKTYGSTLEEWLPDNLWKFSFGKSTSIVKNILKEIGIETYYWEGGFISTKPEPSIATE